MNACLTKDFLCVCVFVRFLPNVFGRPTHKLAELDKDQRENPQQFGALANFRLRTLPVVGCVRSPLGVVFP